MGRKISDMLFATDMDGTLLNRGKKISKENRKAISAFIADGGQFVITTGRSVPATAPYIQQLGIKIPCILYNGAGIYDFEQRQFLWTSSLPNSSRDYLEDILTAFPEVGAEVLHNDCVYAVRMNQHVAHHIAIENLPYQEVGASQVPDGWLKVLFVMDSKVQDRVWEYMMKKGWQDVNFIKSSEIYLEMMPLKTSKGDALLQLAKLLGIQSENTVGIGDYNNDIELIQKSALGFAVANAPEEVKQIADVVSVDCDQNAIAWALDYVRNHLDSF